MTIDEVYKKDKNKMVEILIDNMWIPAIGTDLRIFNRDDELIRVKAVRVRNLGVDK